MSVGSDINIINYKGLLNKLPITQAHSSLCVTCQQTINILFIIWPFFSPKYFNTGNRVHLQALILKKQMPINFPFVPTSPSIHINWNPITVLDRSIFHYGSVGARIVASVKLNLRNNIVSLYQFPNASKNDGEGICPHLLITNHSMLIINEILVFVVPSVVLLASTRSRLLIGGLVFWSCPLGGWYITSFRSNPL